MLTNALLHLLTAITGALLIAGTCFAAPGTLILTGGQVVKGDIEQQPDGSCWLTRQGGAIKFEKDEIAGISGARSAQKDVADERFGRAFSATPALSAPARVMTTPYDEIIRHAARVNNLDPALVKAVIRAESNFNPLDRSCKGACGLMQLMPETARILGVRDIYSPHENIAAGTRFLRDMMNDFKGDTERAIAAYNAGPGPVRRYNDVPPYRETRQYVRNVFRYYQKYRSPRKISCSVNDAGCLTLSNVH